MSPEPIPQTDELLFAIDEAGIARITLNRPQARNALTFAMYEGGRATRPLPPAPISRSSAPSARPRTRSATSASWTG